VTRYDSNPGGVVWSNDPYQRQHPYNRQAASLAAFGVVSLGGTALGFANIKGKRGFQHLYELSQVAERALPPLQWLRTFRFPSHLAPVAAPATATWEAKHFTSQIRSRVSGNVIGTKLAGDETSFMLRNLSGITGMNEQQLTKAGLLEHGLTYQRTGLMSGDLLINKKKIASDIVLTRFAEGTLDPLALAQVSTYDPELATAMSKSTRKMAEAELGLHTTTSSKSINLNPSFNTSSLRKRYASKRSNTILHYRNAPMEFFPTTVGPAGEAQWIKHVPKQLRPLLGGVRAHSAFGAQRLDMVMRSTIERIPGIGKKLAGFLPKPASFVKMQWKYIGMAAAIGSAALAVDQFDWFKRQHSLAGSGMYGGVAGAAALALNAHPTTALFAAGATAAVTSAPGMEGGVQQGIATYYMKAQMVKSRLTNAIPIRYLPIIGGKYRQFVSDTFTGADSAEMALGAGLVAWGATEAYRAYKIKQETGTGTILGHMTEPIMGYRSQWKKVMESYGHEPSFLKFARQNIRGEYKQGVQSGLSLVEKAPSDWYQAATKAHRAVVEMTKRAIAPDSWRTGGAHRVRNVMDQIALDSYWAEKVWNTEGLGQRLWAQIRGTIEGADIQKAFKGSGKWYQTKSIPLGKIGMPVVLGALAWAAATGQFASKDTPAELKAKMEGRELVPINKGRYWEGGGTPWRGTHTMYHRPHWYAMMTSRAKQKAAWGPDEDKMSPVKKWFLQNFTYEMERRNYQSRPYPISGSAFQETPFGAALLRPIGNLIKPPKLMHVNEWAMYGSESGIKLMHDLDELESQPSEQHGGFGPGAPISPFSGRAVIGQQHYQWAEQAGLLGYMHMSGFGLNPFSLKSMTGSDTLYSQDNWLETSNKMQSTSRNYWDQELGGAFFLSEAFRRFYPRHRSEIQGYNPIANTMPFWIPEQLRSGDPYVKIPFGETRMPGPGYAAINPDVSGVAPSNYPIWHQYAILGDVAMWSKEFRQTQAKIRQLKEADAFSPEALSKIASAEQRIKEREEKLRFDRYVNQYNEETADWSFVRKTAARTWQYGTHTVQRAAEPVEYLTPFGFRVISKLSPPLSPVEEYERSMVYGTRMAFWDKLGRDWLRPAAWSAARNMGYKGIPGWLEEVRDTDEYYDKLEYQKWQTLAQSTPDAYLQDQYDRLSRKTVYGRNPFEQSQYVKSSLPRRERDYYDAFLNTTNPQERERIIELIPAHMRNIYIAGWARMDAEKSGDPRLQQAVARGEQTGGYPINDQLWEQYRAQAGPNQSYADWYKTRELGDYFDTHPLPRPNWVGWHPEVDLQDVKLKMIENEGRDLQDYGLWDSQQRMLARKPYIDNGTIEPVQHSPLMNTRIMRSLSARHGLPPPQVHQYTYYSPFPRTDIDYTMNDSRQGEIEDLQRLLGN